MAWINWKSVPSFFFFWFETGMELNHCSAHPAPAPPGTRERAPVALYLVCRWSLLSDCGTVSHCDCPVAFSCQHPQRPFSVSFLWKSSLRCPYLSQINIKIYLNMIFTSNSVIILTFFWWVIENCGTNEWRHFLK